MFNRLSLKVVMLVLFVLFMSLPAVKSYAAGSNFLITTTTVKNAKDLGYFCEEYYNRSIDFSKPVEIFNIPDKQIASVGKNRGANTFENLRIIHMWSNAIEGESIIFCGDFAVRK